MNKTIVADPERAPAVWELFNLYASGEYSIRRLQVHAARVGLTNRKGTRLSRSSIAQFLKNPFYTGDFVWNGKRYQGKHPPIVDKELFDRVQMVMAQRNDTRATEHHFAYTGLLTCAHCGCAVTAEIKKEQYIYYHCTFDKGTCGGSYVREKELERQFEAILEGFTFSKEAFEWMRTALKQSAHEKKAFHEQAIERLNAQAAKLRNRLDQIYLDKLDGEIDESFYRIHVAAWRKEHDQTLDRIRRHQKANENYIDQGLRLLELARNAHEFFHTHGQEQRAVLLKFILQGSTLQDGKIKPTFKPPFDIIHGLAADARTASQPDIVSKEATTPNSDTNPPEKRRDIKKQVAGNPTTCPISLPRLDEYRTYCYENEIGPIPDILRVRQ